MFNEFSIKRLGLNMWEIKVVGDKDERVINTTHAECAVYLDKATELVEDLARKSYNAVKKDLEA